MTIHGVPARFCSLKKCGEDIYCTCGEGCMHTGMCCYNAVEYNAHRNERRQQWLDDPGTGFTRVSELQKLGPKVLLKSRVPYYVTECTGTFAGKIIVYIRESQTKYIRHNLLNTEKSFGSGPQIDPGRRTR